MLWATLTAQIDGSPQTGEQKRREIDPARGRAAQEMDGLGRAMEAAAYLRLWTARGDGGFNLERALLRWSGLQLWRVRVRGVFVASLIGSSSLTPWRGGEAEAVPQWSGGGRRRQPGAGGQVGFSSTWRRGRENELRGRSVRTTRALRLRRFNRRTPRSAHFHT